MTEQELLIDCLKRLNRMNAAYMVTGSMASNYWGIPRSTHDLDFVLQLPRSSIPLLVSAFADSFFLQREAIESAYRSPHQFNLIDQRSALKIDFWVLHGDPFEESMFDRRLRIVVFGVDAWIATPEDVILHKLYWNRLNPSDRQVADASGVVAVQQEKLDKEYLRTRASQLNVSTVLEDLLAGRSAPKST
jgi:hypothetical protein